MELITTEEEIKDNLATFEDYLCEGTDEQRQFAHNLIKGGSCFIAYEIEGELRFSPSRYVGYVSNTMIGHIQNTDKDGRETNVAINAVMEDALGPGPQLETEYLRFASGLGVKPHNKERKYWKLNIEGIDFPKNISSMEGFPEGKIVERTHLLRERNPQLAAAAKRNFITDKGKLFCVVCSFDFEEKYGKRGRGFIEAHHTIPVSEMLPGDETKLEDIALVCSNCHRMLHRYRPWLNMDSLKKLLASEG